MKKLLIILIFGITIQTYSQIQVNIFFYNECENKIEKVEYDLYDLKTEKEYFSKNTIANIDTSSTFIISTALINNDYLRLYSKTIEIKNNKKYIDTLSIPRILFTIKPELHSLYWNYFNCNKLCDGKEIDFYPNGNIRLEGIFKNGKPIEIIHFRENGTKENKEFYDYGKLSVKRLEYYNEYGELDEYEIHKLKNKKSIIRIYDSKDKFLRKKIEKHYIERYKN